MSYKANNKVDAYYIEEKDFLPIQDDRVICSGIDDIDNGDNFYEYANYFYGQYEEDMFDVDLNLNEVEKHLFVLDKFFYHNN